MAARVVLNIPTSPSRSLKEASARSITLYRGCLRAVPLIVSQVGSPIRSRSGASHPVRYADLTRAVEDEGALLPCPPGPPDRVYVACCSYFSQHELRYSQAEVKNAVRQIFLSNAGVSNTGIIDMMVAIPSRTSLNDSVTATPSHMCL